MQQNWLTRLLKLSYDFPTRGWGGLGNDIEGMGGPGAMMDSNQSLLFQVPKNVNQKKRLRRNRSKNRKAITQMQQMRQARGL